MDTSQYLVIFFQILGSLALLIYGMKVMSEALQKMAGSQLRHILGSYDYQPIYGNAYRYLYYLCRSEFLCNYRDDGFLCECRFAHLGSGHLRDYGCQYRYHVYGMDYVAGL